MIQLCFRVQARRSQFRRRQTSSRIATFAEAFSSIAWAATAALAAAGTWTALGAGAIALAMLAAIWLVSPSRP
jgi:ABC-2 type transport system permease protein